MIEIRLFRTEDCLAIAKAHLKYLSTSFKGRAGLHLLNIYYEAITSQTGGVGFVALKDGELVGFICGIWDQHAIKETLMQRRLSLLVYGIWQILQNPRIIPELLSRTMNPRILNSLIQTEGYELRPIVVVPTYRGQHIADTLTRRLLDDAKQRGFTQIFLLTEANNQAATRFYMRFGFKFERQIDQWKSQINLFYYPIFPDNVLSEENSDYV